MRPIFMRVTILVMYAFKKKTNTLILPLSLCNVAAVCLSLRSLFTVSRIITEETVVKY